MSRFVLGVAFGLLFSPALIANTLYGVQFLPSGHVGVLSMDPVTGATAQVADTGVTSFSGPNSTFDPVGRRYFLVSGAGNLQVVNVGTGVTTQLTGALAQMEFDPVTGLLYGVGFLPSGDVGVFTMDRTTGAKSSIADTGVTSFFGSNSAFDPVGRRYFLVSGVGNLVVVNVTTGIPTQVAGAVAQMQFDFVSGLLYGLSFLPSGNVGLFSMNPVTGVMTQIADTGVTSFSGPNSAFDPIGRRYFFVSGANLRVVDVVTGVTTQVAGALSELEFDSGASAVSIPASNLPLLIALTALIGLVAVRRIGAD